jgi:hypothetical protein
MLASASISAEVWVAIIAALASLSGAVISGLFTRSNNAAVKKLEVAQAETNAKIAYSYEARKRLYALCEPLIFQAAEQAEEACSRICSIAKTARNGHLRTDGSGWLDPTERLEPYYFNSTVYGLLAPITAFCILHRRLTTIDLGLDTDVRTKYEMLKLIFFSLQNDWELAASGERLEYDRNKSDPGEPDREDRLREAPQRYAPQGLYRVMTYVVAEAFVSSPNNLPPPSVGGVQAERCVTFGEFEREWKRAEKGNPSPMAPVFETLIELFGGFHPKRKPVLWRVLLAQFLLYRSLLDGRPQLIPLTEEERASFDWRKADEQGEDYEQPVSIAERFVSDQLATLRARLEPM